MKVPIEIISFFEGIDILLKRAEELSIPILKKIADEHDGFFESRIKSRESFTQRIQKGDMKSIISSIPDLIAGTIVLPTRDNIEPILSNVRDKFTIRKIISDRIKKPTQFDYNDLHLIISIKPEKYESEGPLHRLMIELQVKTLLQYAIGKATHDIIYKGEKVTSRRIRMASQLRAMLEMAEGLMSKIHLADEIVVFEESESLSLRNSICDFIIEYWAEIDRPTDLRRAALIIDNYLKIANISFNVIIDNIKIDPYSKIITLRNVDPIIIVLLIIIDICGDGFFDRARTNNLYFLIPNEVEELLPKLRKIPADLRIDLSLGF